MSDVEQTIASNAPSRTSWAEQMQRQRAEEQRVKAQAKARARRSDLKAVAPNYVALALLLALAASVHGAVFGSILGYIAAFGGLLVGAAVAVLVKRLRVGALMSMVVLFLAYMLFGGALALPQTTLYGVLPTLRTIQMLVVGVLGAWKDLLTVQPPAGVFIGPAVVPYLSAVLAAFLSVTIVLRSSKKLWAVLPAAMLLVIGILWGSQNAPVAREVGIAFAVVSLLWAAWRSQKRRRAESRGIVEFVDSPRRGGWGRWIASAMMIVLSVALAFGGSILQQGQHRTVLRDYVEPPLDLREYHSPISMFRLWNTTEKDTTLLRVEGLQPGERVRLATLDHYDGTVFQIVGDSAGAGFRHVGYRFTDEPLTSAQQTTSLSVVIDKYTGNWVPGVGQTRELSFTSERSQDLAENLFYSDRHLSGIDILDLKEGDAYTLLNVVQPQWADAQLQGRAFLSVPPTQDIEVPESIAEAATNLSGDANPGIEQVRAIENALHTKGFYSDGSDGLSLPGHRADRLEKLVTADQMIGDDDQYAPLMALMLRSLGIPSRVVMGFYPEEDAGGSVALTGKDVHVWVEVPFEGAGWVAFDPTPPRDQVPQTEVPKPKPNPRPQVLQPPEPPEEPSEVPPEVVDEPEDEPEASNQWWPWVVLGAQVVGGTILVLSPWLVLLLVKLIRRRRRRRRGRHDERAAGAWDEVIDRATDLGVAVKADATRREQARRIDADLDGQELADDLTFMSYTMERTPLMALAERLDSAVFGQGEPDEAVCAEAWDSGKQAIRSIRGRLPWYRRVRAAFSVRSLRARHTPMRVRIARMASKAKRVRRDENQPSDNVSKEQG